MLHDLAFLSLQYWDSAAWEKLVPVEQTQQTTVEQLRMPKRVYIVAQ